MHKEGKACQQNGHRPYFHRALNAFVQQPWTFRGKLKACAFTDSTKLFRDQHSPANINLVSYNYN